jgi:hypothetical protein
LLVRIALKKVLNTQTCCAALWTLESGIAGISRVRPVTSSPQTVFSWRYSALKALDMSN